MCRADYGSAGTPAQGARPEGAKGPWLFTGLQAATNALVSRIPEGVAELAKDVLVPSTAAKDGAFALVPYAPADGLWFDLGTPERLAVAEDSLPR